MRKISKSLAGLLGLSICFSVGACNGGNGGNGGGGDREFTQGPVYNGVELSATLWETPDFMESPEDDREEAGTNIKGLYYRTFYQNEETYAFAYLGVPQGVSVLNKAPAVLLIHGGAGSAYWEWVKAWNDKGYVALAMDLEGHVPTKAGTLSSPYTELYTKSCYPGPSNHNYDDSHLPLEDTWMYYAVQTSIIGNSFLHSLEYVDTQNIGVCGVSWGSVITSIITGYDDRFAFSIPIYGTVGLSGKGGNLASYYDKNPEALIWDDDKGLKASDTPMLFLCSNVDTHFSTRAITDTAMACKNAEIIIVKDFLHSQYHATAMPEPYIFADEVVKGEKQLITFNAQPVQNGGEITVTVPTGNSIDRAYVVYTEEDLTGVPSWRKKNCSVDGNRITYEVPAEAKNFYIQIEDGFGRYASTGVVEVL